MAIVATAAISTTSATSLMAIGCVPVAAIQGFDRSRFTRLETEAPIGGELGVESGLEVGLPADGSDQSALDRLMVVGLGGFSDGGSYDLSDAQLGDLLPWVNFKNASRKGLDFNHCDRTVVRKDGLSRGNLRPQFSQSNPHRRRYLALT